TITPQTSHDTTDAHTHPPRAGIKPGICCPPQASLTHIHSLTHSLILTHTHSLTHTHTHTHITLLALGWASCHSYQNSTPFLGVWRLLSCRATELLLFQQRERETEGVHRTERERERACVFVREREREC